MPVWIVGLTRQLAPASALFSCDRLSRILIARLFDEEKDPVQIIKWKEIIEVIEAAVDKCEDVANVIETVTLKNA